MQNSANSTVNINFTGAPHTPETVVQSHGSSFLPVQQVQTGQTQMIWVQVPVVVHHAANTVRPRVSRYNKPDLNPAKRSYADYQYRKEAFKKPLYNEQRLYMSQINQTPQF